MENRPLLTGRVGAVRVAVDANDVDAIVGLWHQSSAHVSHEPSPCGKALVHHGRVVSLLPIWKAFGVEQAESNAPTMTVVLEMEGRSAAFPMEVDGIRLVSDEQRCPLTKTPYAGLSLVCTSVWQDGDDVVHVLDTDVLIQCAASPAGVSFFANGAEEAEETQSVGAPIGV